jgi:hypothetical protein
VATNFPTSIDSLTNPTSSDTLDSPDHAGQHADSNDAIEALQAKVGTDSSAVTTSHDYKITQLEGKSPTITLAGDASGSVTLTNLGSGTLTVTVNDDSHNHTIANVDNLQTTLDGKAASSHSHSYLPLSGGTLTGTIYVGTGTSSIDVLAIRNEVQASNGSSTDPSYTFSSDGDTGIYRYTTNQVGITCGGVVHRFASDGLHLASGDWFRSYGTTGWYNGTYGGGMYMIDSTWVRVYNNKRLLSVGDIRTSNQLQSTRSSTGNISGASLNLGMGNGSGVIFCMNSNGFGPLITIGLGEIFYARNYLNSSWATFAGYITNYSTRHAKENIVSLGEAPMSAGAATNSLEVFDAMEKVRQLRPVSYYWHEQDALPRMPTNEDGTPNERRINALSRLNKIRKNKGLGDFTADYLKHVCGRDCDGSVENPCFRFNNYVTGKVGFIAQEVGDVLPQAAELSEERNEYEHIDTLAIVAVLTKAIQGIDDRLNALETL